MREIKFRVWDDIAKEMIYPHGLTGNKGYAITQSGKVCCLDETSVGGELENLSYRCRAIFWTGLKDKNGVEIYEDDILHVPYNRIGNKVVKFSQGKYSICDYALDSCLVVGNIHENPELLETV